MNLTIDGTKVTVEKGTTVLQAAELHTSLGQLLQSCIVDS